MATYTIITYQCPRCKTDIGRQFGLLSTRRITCCCCGTKVRIDGNVIAQNWGYNFAWVGGLLTWLAMGALALADPQFAATIGNKTLPAATFENRLVIAAACSIPGMLIGLLIGGVGMLLGTIVAFSAADDSDDATGPSPRPAPATGAQSPPRPHTRHILVRAFFVLLWPVVFFFGAAIVIGAVLGGGSPSTESAAAAPASTASAPQVQAQPAPAGVPAADKTKDQVVEKGADKAAPWLLLGTLLVFILGCVGLLPATGRKLRGEPAVPPAAQASPTGSWATDFDVPASLPAAPPSKPRSIFVRGFFTLLWPVVFFIAAALTMSAISGALSAETAELQKQLQQQSAAKHTWWMCLATLLLFVLGCVGMLPWTGAKRK